MDIERLKEAKHELNEMAEGITQHGEKGKQYWLRWVLRNAWFFEVYNELLDKEIEKRTTSVLSGIKDGDE